MRDIVRGFGPMESTRKVHGTPGYMWAICAGAGRLRETGAPAGGYMWAICIWQEKKKEKEKKEKKKETDFT